MSTAFFSHAECRLHDMGPGHPECPQRLDAIQDHLRATGLDMALDFHDAPVATLEQIERAHTVGYVLQLKDTMEQVILAGAPKALDPDTVVGPGTWQAALRAAGAAVAATDRVLDGQAENAFCAVRPPGHHATRDETMGFCFFNNVAIAARHALDVRGLERVAIIDFDVHHGNGTEDIIAGDERVLMCSFFQHPLYPYSGAVPKGTNMVNVPVAPYTRGPALRDTILAMWMPALEAFRPQMIFISAGFDAHREDDLGQLGLVEADYEWITTQLMQVAERHAQRRIVSCLEGGYALSALARSVATHVRVLAGVPSPSPPPDMATPLNGDELAQLGRSLLTPTALSELAVFLGCLGLAWVVVRALRGPQAERGSIWFGRSIVDGVLFPVVALLLALLARRLLLEVMPLAVFRLVVPILVSLVVIRLTVRVLRAALPESQLMRVVERSVSWIAWAGMVLWVTGILPVILDELDDIRWKMGGSTISLRNVIEGALSAVVVMVVALWVSAALESRLLKGAGGNLSLRKMAANALRALLLFVGLMFALTAAGIDLTALGVLGGAVGVGIGFGLQKLASNYVSGFVILAERSVRIGDMVTVDGFEGRITDINTRYTVIRALSGKESIVPNEMLITQRVENSSLADPKVVMSTVVQVAYGTDLEPLLADLGQAIGAVPRVLPEPAASVRLTNFAADGLELTAFFWIADPENGSANVRSDVNLAILRRLNALGVEIPFPQRVVRQG